MASTSPNTNATLVTLPLDLLTNITDKLDSQDEKSLKQTCKRMNFLVANPPPHADHPVFNLQQHHSDNQQQLQNNPDDGQHFLTVGVSRDLIPRDGRSTPMPQSPLPYKAAETLQELELENRDVEKRETERGMELSDDEDEEASSVLSSNTSHNRPARNKFKVKKNILLWTAELDSAPSSPGVRSPAPPASSLPAFTLSTQ